MKTALKTLKKSSLKSEMERLMKMGKHVFVESDPKCWGWRVMVDGRQWMTNNPVKVLRGIK